MLGIQVWAVMHRPETVGNQTSASVVFFQWDSTDTAFLPPTIMYNNLSAVLPTREILLGFEVQSSCLISHLGMKPWYG